MRVDVRVQFPRGRWGAGEPGGGTVRGTPEHGLVSGSTGKPDQLGGAARPAADLGAPTRIVLVRHGVTDFTTAGKLDGRGGPDPLLNAEGRRQAKAVGEGVRAFIGDNAARVMTSSLKRAIETGTAIADELGIRTQIDADWDEQSFGDWDAKSMSYLATCHPQETLRFRGTRTTHGPAAKHTLISKPECWPASNGRRQPEVPLSWPPTANRS